MDDVCVHDEGRSAPHAHSLAGLSRTARRGWLVFPVFVLAALLLCLGISRDYRLKHEDNNALHTTFAHSHQKAGLAITKGHDALIKLRSGKVSFYGHHPPGVGLVLAGVFSVTGRDGPVVVRGVAVAATLLMMTAVWWIVRRDVGEGAALVAALFLAVVPQAAFYGRMVNHEVLALPVIVIMVDRYFAFARKGTSRAGICLVIAAAVGALLAWVTFFSLAACAVHAAVAMRRRTATFPGASRALMLVVSMGISLFAFNLAHIAWVKGGDLSGLAEILARRVGAGQPYGPFDWAHKMLGFSRRLITVSGTVALGWLGIRTLRALAGKVKLDPVEEIAAVFLSAGLGYLVVFNWGAWQHHYWQFPMLPAAAIAFALAASSISARARRGPRPKMHRILLALIIVEVVASSTVGLSVRHLRAEDRVIDVVENLRTKFL